MWTTPHDWTNEKVTATLMNLVRDNLRVLYQPPHCRIAGLGSRSRSNSTSGVTDWNMIDFPNTVADNDGMRTLTGVGQNEPATALIETQTAGHYLASSVIGFGPILFDTGAPLPPLLSMSQLLAVSVRTSYTAGRAQVGYATGGAGDYNNPSPVIPVLAAYSCLAGYQWFVELYAPDGSGDMILVRDGKIPYFYLTWIGGS